MVSPAGEVRPRRADIKNIMTGTTVCDRNPPLFRVGGLLAVTHFKGLPEEKNIKYRESRYIDILPGIPV